MCDISEAITSLLIQVSVIPADLPTELVCCKKQTHKKLQQCDGSDNFPGSFCDKAGEWVKRGGARAIFAGTAIISSAL